MSKENMSAVDEEEDNEDVLELGAVASVQASTIEKTLYNEMYQQMRRDRGTQNIQSVHNVEEEAEERMLGLERELWVLKTTLYGEEDQIADEGGKDAQIKAQDEPETKVSSTCKDSLQVAVMEQRLSSLQKEYDDLSLKYGLGRNRCVDNAPVEASRANKKLKKRNRDGDDGFVLVDVDLFENARQSKGKLSRDGSLIETERDRLIRLVRHTCQYIH